MRDQCNVNVIKHEYKDMNLEDYCDISQPVIVAHRGASRSFPENSVAAFKEAINMAMVHPEIRFFIETDVRATKDGTLVLMHDADVSKKTTGSGFVEDMSYAQIQQLKLKPIESLLTHSEISDARVPRPHLPITDNDNRIATLEELIQLVHEANHSRGKIGSPIGLDLHIKMRAPASGFSYSTEVISGTVSAIMDGLGFYHDAKKILGETPSIIPLSQLINEHVQQNDLPPMLIFSDGGIGKRDMIKLWKTLSPEAQQQLTQPYQPQEHNTAYIANYDARAMVYSEPHKVAYSSAGKENAIKKLYYKLNTYFGRHWSIGGIEADTKNTSVRPEYGNLFTATELLDTPQEIKTALSHGNSLIVTNYPQQAIDIVKSQMMEHDMKELLIASPTIEPHFAQAELTRRQQASQISAVKV